MKAFKGIVLGAIVSVVLVQILSRWFHQPTSRDRLVAEDGASALTRIAIHYAPNADPVALGVWRQLFAVLPAAIDVEVEVARRDDFDRLLSKLGAAHTGHLERFHPVVVGHPITTWARDRYAALADASGARNQGAILAPPRIEAMFAARAGDFESPYAISRALYHREPRVADIVFEGGDLAATPRFVFADVNLPARNAGHGPADRATIERELQRRFDQALVWLGESVGDVPRHHIMMYMVPLDDHTIAVGDVRAGAALLAHEPAGADLELDDVELEAARFDRAAAILVSYGFAVVRVPALVLSGAGSYVTYTNALFDRNADGKRVVYLPTYALPALDEQGKDFYERQGFDVYPIDVSPIYKLNGSLGCLVNVLARH